MYFLFFFIMWVWSTRRVQCLKGERARIKITSKGIDIYKQDNIKYGKGVKYLYKPKTEGQEIYVRNLESGMFDILFGIGPAGTGKTLFACQHAIHMLYSKKIEKIILTRPLVSVDEELGFLPGNIQKKMDPWTKPIMDIFHEYFSPSEVKCMIDNNIIDICPLAYMRGRTFKYSYIIADEMQNSSEQQMLMALTRIGEGSRMVITGDLSQTDMNRNGLKDVLEKIRAKYGNGNYIKDGINVSVLNGDDVQRHPIIKVIHNIYS
jgi:phosphate starvation-inducible PhoH-like protein